MKIDLETCLAIMLIFGLPGCSSAPDEWQKNRPAVIQTTGQVLYKGKPVDSASVFFAAEDNSRSGYALTDKGGRFRLTTFEEGDGVVPGRHRVTITKVVVETDQPPDADDKIPVKVTRHVFLPEKYGDAQTSPLFAEVTVRGPNDFVFDLVDP